jgi:uncharacterized repeat protein (TIGR01451 family)
VVPATATAADPPQSSVVDVSSTNLSPGETFTVTQTVTNTTADITVLGAKPTLYVNGGSLTDSLELVGCAGASSCGVYSGIEFRAAVGDVPPGESRSVVWTLHVKDSAQPGSFVLWHVFLGDNFAFPGYAGPTITIKPKAADIAVGLSASVKLLATARITYTITVKNNGPGDATGVRVVATAPFGTAYYASTCTRVGTTRSVNCDFATLASGATQTRTLTVNTGLLTAGTLTATAERTASSPDDPVATNDKATKSCSAITGLLVSC